MLKRLLLTVALTVGLLGNACAAYSDFDSRQWWVDRSGISTGTITQIQYSYLGSLGYTGSLNDRLRAWLVALVGQNLTLNELIYDYFELGICNGATCADTGVPNGALTFNGAILTFNGAVLTFNP